jgi:hypothetical protein
MTSERAALVLVWLDERYESRSTGEQQAILQLEPSTLALLVGYHALGAYASEESPALVSIVRTWLETKTTLTRAVKGGAIS